jgi:pimeloyl-ACP methyl ester carboxylesterase
MPTAQDFADMRDAYQQLSPHPERFDAFIAATGQANLDMTGWSDEQLAGITAPTLVIIGDYDFITIEHAALMKELIPGAQLAVLPNTTHMDATRRPELLVPMISTFLG